MASKNSGTYRDAVFASPSSIGQSTTVASTQSSVSIPVSSSSPPQYAFSYDHAPINSTAMSIPYFQQALPSSVNALPFPSISIFFPSNSFPLHDMLNSVLESCS